MLMATLVGDWHRTLVVDLINHIVRRRRDSNHTDCGEGQGGSAVYVWIPSCLGTRPVPAADLLVLGIKLLSKNKRV